MPVVPQPFKQSEFGNMNWQLDVVYRSEQVNEGENTPTRIFAYNLRLARCGYVHYMYMYQHMNACTYWKVNASSSVAQIKVE